MKILTQVVLVSLVLASGAPGARAGIDEDCQHATGSARIDACRKVIAAGTSHGAGLAWAYHNIGYAYSLQGEYARAIPEYSRAIELKPDYAGAYVGRGWAYYSTGLYRPALKDFDAAIKLDPADKYALNNRCVVHKRREDYDAAIVDCSAALALDPAFAWALYNRADAHFHKRDDQKALRDFRAALDHLTAADQNWRHTAMERIEAIEQRAE